MKILCSILLAGLLAVPASAGSPERLADFESVMGALRSGRAVQAVIDYKRCELYSLKKSTAAPAGQEETGDPACALSVRNKPGGCYFRQKESFDAVGGMRITTWEYFGKGFIGPKAYVAASDTKLIALRGFVLNYGSIRIYEDDAVKIRVNYLKTADSAAESVPASETPLTATKEGPVEAKKLAAHEHVIVMDEIFECRISRGRDNEGASFFSVP